MGKIIINSGPDGTNNPSLVVLGGQALPQDTVIYINGKKILVVDKILDGVSVTERISREPYEIEFECVLRTSSPDNSLNYDKTSYIFPQDTLDSLWQQIWLPDTVQQIQNTYLNKLGILEMVIESIKPTTFRGSKNIALNIRGIENVPGQTLII